MRSVPCWSAPLVVAALGVAMLSGCVPAPAPDGELTGPNPSGDPTGQPAPTLTAEPTATPISQRCDDLISAETIYGFNPNFTLIDPFTPAPGSIGASATALRGIACRWQNQTSGDNIDVSVAQLDPDTLAGLRGAAGGTPAPDLGDAAFFLVGDNGVSALTVFVGAYWIVVESPAFASANEETDLVKSVIAGLGA